MKSLVFKILLFFAILISELSMYAQEEPVDANKPLFQKHELGFSIGVFPTIGAFFSPPDEEGIWGSLSGEPIFGHTDYLEREDGNYVKMYHLGSYSLNYNYHFNSKHSIGTSLAWVGKQIDTYWTYSETDIVNGSGWKHYLTLQISYRHTYFCKDKISLFWGISHGVTLCIRDKNITPKEIHHYLLGSVSNARYYFGYALHLNAFGMEIGKKYKYFIELGIGTQGLLKTGFRYKF